MIIVASANGGIALKDAMEVLEQGGSALDAVELAAQIIEAHPEDHTVGYSGYPNILGDVELDGSIMDGSNLAAGAVGGVKGYLNVVSIARKVMEELPHTFLVGAGAERFAGEMGFERSNLLSPEAKDTWQRRLEAEMPEEAFADLQNLPDLKDWVRLATDPERTKGTVNFLARDKDGDIASAVSTSGWAWKYPGRLGDSPVIGAGNYADNRYGAAACTGMGEMAARACTAHSIIMYLKQGMSLSQAGACAMQDLRDLGGDFISVMNIVCLGKDGEHKGFSSEQGKTYAFIESGMSEAEELPREYVSIPPRWRH